MIQTPKIPVVCFYLDLTSFLEAGRDPHSLHSHTKLLPPNFGLLCIWGLFCQTELSPPWQLSRVPMWVFVSLPKLELAGFHFGREVQWTLTICHCHTLFFKIHYHFIVHQRKRWTGDTTCSLASLYRIWALCETRGQRWQLDNFIHGVGIHYCSGSTSHF